MRLIIIEAAALRCHVYEGRRLAASYTAAALLNADEIEDVRTAVFEPAESATDGP
jgi:hypothetical protein